MQFSDAEIRLQKEQEQKERDELEQNKAKNAMTTAEE